MDIRVLMVGLDAAGKNTILYKLNFRENITTIPTVNVRTVKYKRAEFMVWDLGGQEKIRPFRRHYCKETNAVIFVVDCDDRDRIAEAKKELHQMLQEEDLRDAYLLVLANKQVLHILFV